MAQPIKKEEIVRRIPDSIIEEVNEHIKENYDGNRAYLSINTLCRFDGYRLGDFFLIKSLYEKNGWKVGVDDSGDYNILVFE